MSDLRTAAQQALEALEKLVVGTEYEEAVEAERAIDALKAALEEPVLNPAPGYCKHCKQYTIEEPLPAEPVQEPQCNPHPKAPHGFLRNASHTENRYVCECEGWEPYEAGYQAGMEAALRAQS